MFETSCKDKIQVSTKCIYEFLCSEGTVLYFGRSFQSFKKLLIPVLRIHDILVWIRIRGTMPLTNGSGCGSGSCYFRH
jgi:hypothetical protein